MGKVYRLQTALKFILNTYVDFNTYSTSAVYVKYKKPSGATGQWTGAVESASEGKISYTVTSSVIDESGTWTFWAYVEFADGRTAPGEPFNVKFYVEGK